jgi:hypothetical protein
MKQNNIVPFGKANPLRGLNNAGIGNDFVKKHPLGSALTSVEIIKWAKTREDINPKAALSVHQIVAVLRRVGTSNHVTPRFWVTNVAPSKWMVEATGEKVASYDVSKPVEHLTKSKMRELRYLMESINPSELTDLEIALLKCVWITNSNYYEAQHNNNQAHHRTLVQQITEIQNAMQKRTLRAAGE